MSREAILETFVAKCRGMTALQLEVELCNGSSLFLTRISAWLRLSYVHSQFNIALQLSALSVFIESAINGGGSHFLLDFVETGGIHALVNLIECEKVVEKNKTGAVKILLAVCKNREFKEIVCENKGIPAVCKVLSTATNFELQHECKLCLLELGMGNPVYFTQVYKGMVSILTCTSNSPSSIQTASYVIRSLLPHIPNIHVFLADAYINLLASKVFDIQHEAYEALCILLEHDNLQRYIAKTLIEILCTVIKDEPKLEEHKKHLYIQQIYAIKLLSLSAAKSDKFVNLMESIGIHYGLFVALCTCSCYCQNTITELLQYIMSKNSSILQSLNSILGNNMITMISNEPITFYQNISKELMEKIKFNCKQALNSVIDTVPEIQQTSDDSQTIIIKQPERRISVPKIKSSEEPITFYEQRVQYSRHPMISASLEIQKDLIDERLGINKPTLDADRKMKLEQELRVESTPKPDVLKIVVNRNIQRETQSRFPYSSFE